MWRVFRWIVILAVLIVVGWSGWWYAGAEGQKAGFRAWLDNQRQRGWQAEVGEIEIEGYPTVFDMRALDLALADPGNGWAWRAPLLQAESLAYEPTRITVDWPANQTLAVPGDRAEIKSDRMRTVLDLRPGPSMELRQAATDIAALSIASQQGWSAGAEKLFMDLAEKPADLGPPNSYDLNLEAVAVMLPQEIVDAIDPTGWLEARIDRFTVQGHAAFDDALGRETIETGKVALRTATIREAGFEWGEMRLVLTGDFKVDDDGFPVGEIAIEAREWRQMVRLAVRSKLIGRDLAETITTAVEVVTMLAGTGDTLKAPLGLSGGKVRIGPIAIADAPRLAPSRY